MELYCPRRRPEHRRKSLLRFIFTVPVTAPRFRDTLSVLSTTTTLWYYATSGIFRVPRQSVSDIFEQGSYGQFCPVAMAAEIMCSRWTALVLRELLCGTTRFNDFRRGVPRMSPTLLSKRLKSWRRPGLSPPSRWSGRRRRIQADKSRRGSAPGGHVARRLGPALGRILSVPQESRSVAADVGHAPKPRSQPLPPRSCTIKFACTRSSTAGLKRSWWRVIEGGQVDLCKVNPGYEVDLYVRSSLRSMTAVWMGMSTVGRRWTPARSS